MSAVKMTLLSFSFLLAFALHHTRAELSCEQVEIMFVLDSSSSTNETYYNTAVKDFVLKVSESFRFTDDVTGNDKHHARFGMAVYGDTNRYKISVLTDESREQFLRRIDNHIIYEDYGEGAAYNGLAITQRIISLSSLDMNRVVILVTSQVTVNDVNNAATRWIHDMVEVVIGVGMPGVNGNLVAANLTNMVEIAQNRSEWAFPTIDTALDPAKGVVAQIEKAFACGGVQCTGYIFVMEETLQTNNTIPIFTQALSSLIQSLPDTGNGFQFITVDDSNVDDFPFESAAGAIDRMTHLWIGPLMYPAAPRLDLALNYVVNEINKKEFQNYAVFFMAETDVTTQTLVEHYQADRLARANAQVFVLDVSQNPKDPQLFSKMVGGKTDHILKGDNLTLASLNAMIQKTVQPVLQALKC